MVHCFAYAVLVLLLPEHMLAKLFIKLYKLEHFFPHACASALDSTGHLKLTASSRVVVVLYTPLLSGTYSYIVR